MAGSSTVMGLGYDVQGNLNNKNGLAYAFDGGNRLRAAAGETDRYDGHGRRIQAKTTKPKAISTRCVARMACCVPSTTRASPK